MEALDHLKTTDYGAIEAVGIGFNPQSGKQKEIMERILSDMYIIEARQTKAIIRFNGARLRNGSCPEFEINKKGESGDAKNLLTLFFSQWPKSKMRKKIGKDAEFGFDPITGKAEIRYPEDKKPFKDYQNGGKEKMMENGVIFDPKSDEALSLIGEKVVATNIAWDFDKTAVKGKLVKVNEKCDVTLGLMPFIVETAKGENKGFFCIRKAPEPQLQPYKLAEASVRDALMLKVYKSKDAKGSYVEQIITTFKNQNGSWTVNGLSAAQLLNGFIWLDGTPCGEIPVEE